MARNGDREHVSCAGRSDLLGRGGQRQGLGDLAIGDGFSARTARRACQTTCSSAEPRRSSGRSNPFGGASRRAMTFAIAPLSAVSFSARCACGKAPLSSRRNASRSSPIRMAAMPLPLAATITVPREKVPKTKRMFSVAASRRSMRALMMISWMSCPAHSRLAACGLHSGSCFAIEKTPDESTAARASGDGRTSGTGSSALVMDFLKSVDRRRDPLHPGLKLQRQELRVVA